jgi:hypothetical protein
MAAAALAKFRTKVFNSHIELYNYVVADNSDVNSVVSIITDNNGKYILFYMVA